MQLRLQKPDIERFIDEQVKAGRFPNAEAVVESAVFRMMEEEVVPTSEDFAAFQKSERQIDDGESVEFGEFAARMRRKHHI
jgi:Arc/MetJ-type ribon-helix-helix transcriptional regulator